MIKNKTTVGSILLLAILFFLNLSYSFFERRKEDVYKEVFFFELNEIDAYKKITLGIPISINRESEEGLCAIPGIGPSLAKRIVEERRKKGGFKSKKELLEVKGIGKRLFKKILPYISL